MKLAVLGLPVKVTTAATASNEGAAAAAVQAQQVPTALFSIRGFPTTGAALVAQV
jgi:hypothetical protein